MNRFNRLGLVAGLAAIWLFSGCNSGNTEVGVMPAKRTPMQVPAPVSKELPYEFAATLGGNWSSDTLELLTPDGIHCVRLIGIDCPEKAQSMYEESRRLVSKTARRKPLTVQVLWRDDSHVEFGRVEVDGKDLGLELVRAGLAWYDGSEFEGSDEYSLAQSAAQEKKIAIWSEESPVAPWDFYRNEIAAIRDKALGPVESEPAADSEQ